MRSDLQLREYAPAPLDIHRLNMRSDIQVHNCATAPYTTNLKRRPTTPHERLNRAPTKPQDRRITRKLFLALKTFTCVMAIMFPLAFSFFAWKTYKYFTTKTSTYSEQTAGKRAITHDLPAHVSSYTLIQRASPNANFQSLQDHINAYKSSITTFLTSPDKKALLWKGSVCFFSIASLVLLYSREGSWCSVGLLALFQGAEYLKAWADVLQSKRIEELEGRIGELEREIEGLRLESVGAEGWDVCGGEE